MTKNIPSPSGGGLGWGWVDVLQSKRARKREPKERRFKEGNLLVSLFGVNGRIDFD
jgi:hypothetical protein